MERENSVSPNGRANDVRNLNPPRAPGFHVNVRNFLARVLVCTLGLVCASPAAALDNEPAGNEPLSLSGCEVAIMELDASGLDEKQQHIPQLIAGTIASQLSEAGCSVITAKDIAQLVDYEEMKAQCGEGTDSCLVELGSALGVEKIVVGTVGRLGESYKLQVKLQNADTARVEKRLDKTISGTPEDLEVAAKNAARELFGLPLLKTEVEDSESGTSWTVITGSALAATGLVVGVGALATFAAANYIIVPKALGTDFPADTRSSAQLAGLVSLGIAPVALVVAAGGAGLATYGLLAE